jgi:hypothetical protein
MPGPNNGRQGRFYDGLVNNILVNYSVGRVVALHIRITAIKYVGRLCNQVHSMIQTLFPNNNAVFRKDNAHIYTAGTVQSWIEEHDGKLQHLPWITQSPDLNNTEPLWSVSETE